MPGLAQVWLTDKEIHALSAAATQKGTTVSESLWEGGLRQKLEDALGPIACPVIFPKPKGDDLFRRVFDE